MLFCNLEEGSYADWLYSTIASKLMDYYNYYVVDADCEIPTICVEWLNTDWQLRKFIKKSFISYTSKYTK